MKNAENFNLVSVGVNTILIVGLTVTMMAANNRSLEQLEEMTAKADDLTIQLIQKDTTISELKDIISETEDDIASIEVQYQQSLLDKDNQLATLIDENDTITLLYAKEKANLMSAYDSMLTDDQRFLAEYVANGGTIEDIGVWKCTAYCTERYPHICGTGSGITACGEPVISDVSVAVNKHNLSMLPFGTKIYIEGVGVRCVMDVGGGVAKNQFDCAHGTHQEALRWSGVGNHRAWILE